MRFLVLTVVIAATLINSGIVNAQEGSCVATPIALTDGVTFTGTGHQVVDVGLFTEGVYIVKGTYLGTDYWGAYMVGRDTGANKQLFATTGPTNESTILQIREGQDDNYLMEVVATSVWVIVIQRA